MDAEKTWDAPSSVPGDSLTHGLGVQSVKVKPSPEQHGQNFQVLQLL